MKQITTATMILSTLLFVTQATLADMAVIANPASPVDTASKDELKSLYLGKAKALGGSKAVPVDQAKDSDVSLVFYESVVGKSASQIRAYWSKLVFTGKGRPPKKIEGDIKVVAAVAADPALIGYVKADAVDDSVKVLMLLK